MGINSVKNFLFGVFAAIIILGIGFFAYWLGLRSVKPKETPAENAVVTATPTLFQEMPLSVSPTVSPTKGEDAAAENITDLIKATLMKKNNWPSISGTLKISTNDGTYASGSLVGDGGGGYWFAKKINGEWVIVADGNGVITCAQMAPYPDFPKTLIPECYDEATGKNVVR